MIQGVLFDLDGTLVDSVSTIGLVLNEMRIERKLQPLPYQQYRSLVSLGAELLVQKALELNTGPLGELKEFRQRYGALKTSSDDVFTGARDLLRFLVEKSVKLAICSNKPRALCLKVLEDINLLSFFDVVVGGDTASHPKPDAAPILLALSKIGCLADNAILIGDSTVDQLGARAAGVKFAFFAGGYNDGVKTSECLGTFKSLAEIRSVFTHM